MSTPAPYEPPVVQGTVVSSPPRVSSPSPGAVFRLGELLKTIVHQSVGVFKNENDLLGALTVVDDFVRAFVPGSAMAALAVGDEQAPREDVSQRVAPTTSNPATAYPGLDYGRLARAILAAQQEQVAE